MAKVKRSEVGKPTTEDEPIVDSEKSDKEVPSTQSPSNSITRTLVLALAVVSVVAVCLAIALVILLVRGNQTSTQPPATTATTASTGIFGTKYVSINPNVKADAIVVEIHSDYQCPWCERAEAIYGDAMYELSQSGDIDLRIHIRTLVGDQIIRNDSSQRATMAALCADQVGQFWAYHSTIFLNQPEEGKGYTDQQLRNDFATQAGLTGRNLTNFQTCYDTKATLDATTAMEQDGTSMGINGTPTFLVNGVKVSFNMQTDSATVTKITTDDLLAGLKQIAGES